MFAQHETSVQDIRPVPAIYSTHQDPTSMFEMKPMRVKVARQEERTTQELQPLRESKAEYSAHVRQADNVKVTAVFARKRKQLDLEPIMGDESPRIAKETYKRKVPSTSVNQSMSLITTMSPSGQLIPKKSTTVRRSI